jgi:CDP-diglyceride synthetase
MKQLEISKEESAASAGSNKINRIVTAFVGAFIILALLHWGNSTFWIVTAFMFFGCFYEFITLVGRARRARRHPIEHGAFGERTLHFFFSHLFYLISMLYIALIFSLNALLGLENGRILVLFTLIGTWAFDTAAFYVGTARGVHKIIPKISPNKSFEGLLAGVAAVSIVSVFLPLVSAIKIGWFLAISLAAFAGDVIESRFKRRLGVKDSSALLPGHGGFLDRFDSLILTSFVSYLIFRWLM